MPKLVPCFYWTLVFEWLQLGVTLRTNTKKITCLKEIGLHAQNMLTIIGSRVNIIGKGETYIYDENMSTRTFTLTMNQILIRALIIIRKSVATQPQFVFANHLVSTNHMLIQIPREVVSYTK